MVLISSRAKEERERMLRILASVTTEYRTWRRVVRHLSSIERFSPPHCLPEDKQQPYVTARASLRASVTQLQRHIFRPNHAASVGASSLETEVNPMRWPPLCHQADAFLRLAPYTRLILFRSLHRDPIVAEAHAKLGAAAVLAAGRSEHAREIVQCLVHDNALIAAFRDSGEASENPYLPQMPTVSSPASIDFQNEVEAAKEMLSKVASSDWADVGRFCDALFCAAHFELTLECAGHHSSEIQLRSTMSTGGKAQEFLANADFVSLSSDISALLRVVLRSLKSLKRNEDDECLRDSLRSVELLSPNICQVGLDLSAHDKIDAVTWSEVNDTLLDGEPLRLRKCIREPDAHSALLAAQSFVDASLWPQRMTTAEQLLWHFDRLAWNARQGNGKTWDAVVEFDSQQTDVLCELKADDSVLLGASRAPGPHMALCGALASASAKELSFEDHRFLAQSIHESLLCLPAAVPSAEEVRCKNALKNPDPFNDLHLISRGVTRILSSLVSSSVISDRASSQSSTLVPEARDWATVARDVEALCRARHALSRSAEILDIGPVSLANFAHSVTDCILRWGALKCRVKQGAVSILWLPGSRWEEVELKLHTKHGDTQQPDTRPETADDFFRVEYFARCFPEPIAQWYLYVAGALSGPLQRLWHFSKRHAGHARHQLWAALPVTCRKLRRTMSELHYENPTNVMADLNFPRVFDDLPTLLCGALISAIHVNEREVRVALQTPEGRCCGTASSDGDVFSAVFRAANAAHPQRGKYSPIEGARALRERTTFCVSAVSCADGTVWLRLLESLSAAASGGHGSIVTRITADQKFSVHFVIGTTCIQLSESTFSVRDAIRKAIATFFGVTVVLPLEASLDVPSMPEAVKEIEPKHSPLPSRKQMKRSTERPCYLSLINAALCCLTIESSVTVAVSGSEARACVSFRGRAGDDTSRVIPAQELDCTASDPVSALTDAMEKALRTLLGDESAGRVLFAAHCDTPWWGVDRNLCEFDQMTFTPRKILDLRYGNRVTYKIQRTGASGGVGVDERVTAVARFNPFYGVEFDVGCCSALSSEALAIADAATRALHHCFRLEFKAARALRFLKNVLGSAAACDAMHWKGPPSVAIVSIEDQRSFRAVLLSSDGPLATTTALSPTEAFVQAVDASLEIVIDSHPELAELMEVQAPVTSAFECSSIDRKSFLGLLRAAHEGTDGDAIVHRWLPSENRLELRSASDSAVIIAAAKFSDGESPIATILSFYAESVIKLNLSNPIRSEIQRSVQRSVSRFFTRHGRHVTLELLQDLVAYFTELQLVEVSAAMVDLRWVATLRLRTFAENEDDKTTFSVLGVQEPTKKKACAAILNDIADSLALFCPIVRRNSTVWYAPAEWLTSNTLPSAAKNVPPTTNVCDPSHAPDRLDQLASQISAQRPKCVLHAILLGIGVMKDTVEMPKLNIKLQAISHSTERITAALVAPCSSSGETLPIGTVLSWHGASLKKISSGEPADGSSVVTPRLCVTSAEFFGQLMIQLWSFVDTILDAEGFPNCSARDLIARVSRLMKWDPSSWRALPVPPNSADVATGPRGSALVRQILDGQLSVAAVPLNVTQSYYADLALSLDKLPELGRLLWVATVDIDLPLYLCSSSASSQTTVRLRLSTATSDKKALALRTAERAAARALFPPLVDSALPADWIRSFPPTQGKAPTQEKARTPTLEKAPTVEKAPTQVKAPVLEKAPTQERSSLRSDVPSVQPSHSSMNPVDMWLPSAEKLSRHGDGVPRRLISLDPETPSSALRPRIAQRKHRSPPAN